MATPTPIYPDIQQLKLSEAVYCAGCESLSNTTTAQPSSSWTTPIRRASRSLVAPKSTSTIPPPSISSDASAPQWLDREVPESDTALQALKPELLELFNEMAAWQQKHNPSGRVGKFCKAAQSMRDRIARRA